MNTTEIAGLILLGAYGVALITAIALGWMLILDYIREIRDRHRWQRMARKWRGFEWEEEQEQHIMMGYPIRNQGSPAGAGDEGGPAGQRRKKEGKT